MTVGGQDSCPSCRGQGWKFLMLRRSLANAGGTAARAVAPCARGLSGVLRDRAVCGGMITVMYRAINAEMRKRETLRWILAP
jgi:hypothetical protein